MKKGSVHISQEQIKQFDTEGYLLLNNFYAEDDINAICHAIYLIIGEVIDEHGLMIERLPYHPIRFDDGYIEIIRRDRRLGSVIYDAVKQIPAFVRLVADWRNEQLFKLLRRGSLPGLAGNGFGIRINNPAEEKFRAAWHQEYPHQLRSRNGIVFWAPLLKVEPDMGPVDILPGSHTEGMLPMTKISSGPDGQAGTYAMRLLNEEQYAKKYPMHAPCTAPGDLLLMNFDVIHRSGKNISNRALWSMQYRLFDFTESVGRKNGWVGSFGAGVDFSKFHPELLLNQGE